MLDSSIARRPGSLRSSANGSPLLETTTSRARWKMVLARSCPRAWLSCRTTRARRVACTALSATTARPTMAVTAAICLALMPSRMPGSGMREPGSDPGIREDVHRDQPQRHRDTDNSRWISVSPCLRGPCGREASRLRYDFLFLAAGDAAAQLVELVVQRLQADAEDLRRARLVVARMFERHQDQTALGFLDRRAGLERDDRLDDVGRIGDERRQVLRLDELAVGEDDGALDDVAHLAHVARPVVLLEDARRGRVERRDRLVVAVVELGEERLHQQ